MINGLLPPLKLISKYSVRGSVGVYEDTDKNEYWYDNFNMTVSVTG